MSKTKSKPVPDSHRALIDDADQAVHVGGGEVDHGPLEQRPDALGGVAEAYAATLLALAACRRAAS